MDEAFQKRFDKIKFIRKNKWIYEKIKDIQFESHFRKSDEYLKRIKNKHKGEKGYILATGPSIEKTNLNAIDDENAIAVNTLFRGYERYGLSPNYCAISDGKVLKENFPQIIEKNNNVFLSGHCMTQYLLNYDVFKNTKNDPILIRRNGIILEHNDISKDITKGEKYGISVVFSAIQLAYHLGFKEVYLVGTDCDYFGKGHFDGKPHTFLKGIKPFSSVKEFKKLMRSYQVCKKAFEKDGRKIYNATVGGKLEVFERKKLEKII